MNALAQLQRQAEMAQAVSVVIFIGMLALFVWACLWTHAAFQRYEAREDAKLRALQRIASKLDGSEGTRVANDMTATR